MLPAARKDTTAAGAKNKSGPHFSKARKMASSKKEPGGEAGVRKPGPWGKLERNH